MMIQSGSDITYVIYNRNQHPSYMAEGGKDNHINGTGKSDPGGKQNGTPDGKHDGGESGSEDRKPRENIK